MGSHMRLDICHVLFYEHVSVAVGFGWEKDSVTWMWLDCGCMSEAVWKQLWRKSGSSERLLVEKRLIDTTSS